MNVGIRGIFSLVFLASIGVSMPAFADQIHLSSGRDRAAALQGESVGGTFHSTCISSASFGSNVMENCDSVVLPHNETAVIADPDRKSTRLNSSHQIISYAVFCL